MCQKYECIRVISHFTVIAKHLHHCRYRLFSCIENEVNEVQTRSHNGICTPFLTLSVNVSAIESAKSGCNL